MTWQIYLLISIVLISCNGLFHRSLLKDAGSSPPAQTIAFLGLGGITAFLVTLFQGKLNLFFSPLLIWNFILLIALYTPAFLFKYRAYQLIGASEIAILAVTGRLWNIAGAAIFLHEVITPKIIIGAFLVLVGVVLTRFEKRKITLNFGVVLVLASAFLFGMGEVNGYYILQSYDSANFLIYSYLLPVFVLMLVQPQSIKKISYYFRKDRAIKVVLLSLCDTLGMLTLYLAYQAGHNAAVISPLRSTSLAVTVILAMIFLGERKNVLNKLVGATISVLGVVILL